MASASHLDDLQKSLESLPVELNNNLTLMGDLVSRFLKVMRNIDKLAVNYMSNANKSFVVKNKKSLTKLQHQIDAVKACYDDNIQLSIQSYEMLEKRIRKLDKEIKRFDAEMKLKAEIQKDAIKTSINSPLKKGDSKMSIPEPSIDNVAIESGALTGAFVNMEDKHYMEADMPLNPNEPTFCICKQLSFGQLIACDHPDCPTEFFHLACVNLITKPNENWFCPKCVTGTYTCV